MNSPPNASPSGSQSPAKLGHNSPKRSSFPVAGRLQPRRSIVKRPEKAEKKEEVSSPKTQELLRKMRFKIKVYLALVRTKETIEKHYEEMNPGYKQVRKALQANYRPGSEAKRILNYLRNLPFFNAFLSKFCCDVEDVALIELCKRLKYECYTPGVFLFREGDLTDEKFYIVFRGSLVTIKKPREHVPYIEDQHLQGLAKRDFSDRDSTPKSTSNYRNTPTRDPPTPRLSQYCDNRPRQKSIHFGFRFRFKQSFTDTLALTIEKQISDAGERQKDIKRGESLGEQALTENEPLRRFSALTTTNCEFLVLSKKDYVEIIKKFSRKKLRKGEFMETRIPFLDSIVSPEVWEVLQDSLVEVEYPKGAIIATEKMEGTKIYFIGQGECVLEKNVAIPPRNDRHEIDLVKVKKVIATLGEGSCIGAEIVFNDDQLYTYTIKVKSSSAMLYSVEKSVFLQNFPQQCIDALHENLLVKEQLHEKKIQKIVQEATEEASAESNSLKPLLKASSSLSPTNFRIHPTLYNHMHTPQQKKSENIVVMDSKEAKSFEYEAMILFPKEEKTFERAKNRVNSMFKKRANIATAAGSKRKGITNFLEDPNVVNPHVLMQKSKIKDMIKAQAQEKYKAQDKSMEKDKKLPAIAWTCSPKAKEIQSHYQSLKPLKTIESLSNVEENPDYLLKQLKITSTRMQKNDTTDSTIEIHGDKADLISSTRMSSKQHKRLFSHANSPSLSDKMPTKLTIRLNHDSFLNLRRKESADSPALSAIENWKDKSMQENKDDNQKSEPSSPVSAVKPIIGQESGRSAIKSFAKVLKKTFSTHQSTESLGASPLINISTQKMLMQSRDEASESMDNPPAGTFSAGLKFAQSNSLNVSQEYSHIGTSYRKIRASPAGNSFFQSSPIGDIGLFKNPVILCKQKRKILGKSISITKSPNDSMVSKTPTALQSIHVESLLKVGKVMK